MKHSESLANLGAALALAQAEMKAAPMNSLNPFLNNKFADLGAVIETARPIFTKHGLSLAQFPVSDDNGKIGIENVLLHSSGEWMSESILMELGAEKGKSAAQVAGSIFSYFRRYSWAAIAGLYADEDTDGNQPGKAQQQAKQPQTNNQQPRNEPAAQTGDALLLMTVTGVMHAKSKDGAKDLFKVMIGTDAPWAKYGVTAFKLPECYKGFAKGEVDKIYAPKPEACMVVVKPPSDANKYPEIVSFHSKSENDSEPAGPDDGDGESIHF